MLSRSEKFYVLSGVLVGAAFGLLTAEWAWVVR